MTENDGVHCTTCSCDVNEEDVVFCEITHQNETCGIPICDACRDDAICELCGRFTCYECATSDKDGAFCCVDCVRMCDLCEEVSSDCMMVACLSCVRVVCEECVVGDNCSACAKELK